MEYFKNGVEYFLHQYQAMRQQTMKGPFLLGDARTQFVSKIQAIPDNVALGNAILFDRKNFPLKDVQTYLPGIDVERSARNAEKGRPDVQIITKRTIGELARGMVGLTDVGEI